MIKINLLPGGDKRKTRKAGAGLSLKMPVSMPEFDRMTAFIVAAWIIGPLLGLWMFFGVRGDLEDTRVALDQAVADSTRFANIISTQTRLQARQDTIAQKLQIIQEIDAGRYIWPHVMDEISRALPPFTWLTSVQQIGGSKTNPFFEVQGRTGSLPALTRYMDALEASPFLRNIQLVSSQQVQAGGDPNSVVNEFAVTGEYEVPPLEVVETVPLFEDVDTIAEEDTDGAGTT